ncbi:MAG: hypothetical protein ACYC9O_18930 [Candidatus Latescibacterota bacterium]
MAAEGIRILGEYIDRLRREHDTVLETVCACAELKKDALADDEAVGVADAARNLLVNMANCDGRSVLPEVLDRKECEGFGES